MDRLNNLLGQSGFGGMGGQHAPPGDSPQVDNSEIIYISPLSLLKVHPFFLKPQGWLVGSPLTLDA